MSPVSILMKPASGSCNMLCEYCFYCDEQKNRTQKSYGMMEEKTARNIIRKALAYAEGGCAIAFQGGEPTLRGIDFYYKVVEYVEKYNKKKIPVTYAFQTNGTNINEEWCRLFKNCGFLVGISLDGIWKTHNCYRHAKNGKETFDRILETCKMLKQYDVPFNILTVVHDQTAQYLNEIYSFYSKKGFDYQQYIPCIDPLQQEKGKMHYSLDPAEYGKFLIRLFEKWNEDIRTGRSIYIRQFDNYIGIFVLPDNIFFRLRFFLRRLCKKLLLLNRGFGRRRMCKFILCLIKRILTYKNLIPLFVIKNIRHLRLNIHNIFRHMPVFKYRCRCRVKTLHGFTLNVI